MKHGPRQIMAGSAAAIGAIALGVAIARYGATRHRAQTAAVEAGVTAVPVIEVVEPANCCEYDLRRRLLVTITDSGFPSGALAEVGNRPWFLRDSTYLLTTMMGGALFQTDRSGRITSQVGRPGDGPGEYHWPSVVSATESEILVFDAPRQRITALEPRTFRVLRTTRAPLNAMWPPVRLKSGNYVLTGSLGTTAPVVVITPDGEMVRSWGPVTPPDSLGLTHGRLISAVAGDSAVWLARSDSYRIEQWDTAGNLRRTVVRKPDWFRREGTGEDAKGAELWNVRQDAGGRLWVMSRWARKGNIRTCNRCPVNDLGSETWIEVLDLRARSVVAEWHGVGPGNYSIDGTDQAWTSRFTADGDVLIDVFGYYLVPQGTAISADRKAETPGEGAARPMTAAARRPRSMDQ